MSYSPVPHKRPYGYDSPISNISAEHTSYPNGYSRPLQRPNPLSQPLPSRNPPSSALPSHSFPRVYSNFPKSFPPPQAPIMESYSHPRSILKSSQPLSTTPNKLFEDFHGSDRKYTSLYSSKENNFAPEPQFYLSPKHYIEISNKCDNIVGILSTFERSNTDNVNKLIASAKALYDVFLEAEQKVSPHSPVPSKNTERPKKRTKNNQTKLYCHSCNCTDTPEWRKGPLGPRTLCNACGLIWAKLSKKKAKEAQLAVQKRDAELKPSDLHSTISTKSASNTYTNDGDHIGQISSKATKSTELKDGKIDDKKLTLSFLLS